MQLSLLLSNLYKTITTFNYRKLPILLFFYSLGFQVEGQSVPPAKQWDKTLGGPVDDFLHAMVATPDGGYMLGGTSFQGGEGGSSGSTEGWYDYLAIKIDKDGNKEWQKTFGGSNYDFLYAIVNASDGGYLLGGYSYSGISGDKTEPSRGSYDYWIVKIDKDGNKEWDKTFGGSDQDVLFGMIATPDGGYLLGGNSSSGIGGDKTAISNGSSDYWIVKIDESGNKQWDKSFGGSDYENLKSLVNTTDGGYLLGGNTQSGISGDKSEPNKGFYDYWIVKVDVDGNKVWDKTFGGSNLDDFASVIITADNGYLLGGSSYSGIGGDKSERSRGLNDYWIVKIDGDGNKQWDKTYGGGSGDYLSSLSPTSDGGYLMEGSSNSAIGGDKSAPSKGDGDYWLVKTDDSGNKQWDAVYGGNRSDNLTGTITTQDNGYLLGGQSNSGVGQDKSEPSLGSYDFWVVKLGADMVMQDQTITFDAIPDQTFGDDDFALTATASSGLPVTFTVEAGPATITDNTITLTGAGIVTVTASQDGNATYNSAPPVSITFTVNKATPVITWNPASLKENAPLGKKQLNANASFKNGSVDGSFSYNPPAGSTLPVGLQTLKADFTPADATDFNPVTDITASVTITPYSPIAINSFKPSSGTAGSTVLITGKNLGKAVAVSFNGVSTVYTVQSHHHITATVPEGTVTGLISITGKNGNTVFSNDVFKITYPKPCVLSVTPASSQVGKIVMMEGANLAGTTKVLFNGSAAPYFEVINDNMLQALVPSSATTGIITIVTHEGRGKSSFDFIIENDELSRVNAITEKESVAGIYPNPFKSSFTLKLPAGQEGKGPITLYNIEGKVMLRIPYTQSVQKIELGYELKPGVYILQVGVGKESKKYKVIKGS